MVLSSLVACRDSRRANGTECRSDELMGVGVLIVVLNDHVEGSARIGKSTTADGGRYVVKGIESIEPRIAAIRLGIAELNGSDEFDIALSGVRSRGPGSWQRPGSRPLR